MKWTRDAFAASFDVSRETMAHFDTYAALLAQWNTRINLVARSTLSDVWGRHFADSAQLWRLRPSDEDTWLDMGSGAGLPGMVVALLGRDTGLSVGLVESDQRKATFLRIAARACDLRVVVHDARLEALAPQSAGVLSARALASLDGLLGYAEKHRRPGGICLFPKGAALHKEIEASERTWRFDYKTHPSLTDPEAGILEIGAMRRV